MACQQLALGVLLLAAATATASAKQPMLFDVLLGSSETAHTASAQPASSYDDTTRVCFTETKACGIWGKDQLNFRQETGSTPNYVRYEGAWTSTLACKDCHPGSSDSYAPARDPEASLFYPSSGPVGWCYIRDETYPDRELPFGSTEGILVDGWFDVTCYFGEGDKHTCLPEECSETQLSAAGPFFRDNDMLFDVNPTTASKPTRCDADKAEFGPLRVSLNSPDTAEDTRVVTASASTSITTEETPPTYYQGKGHIYAAAGSLYSRRGPFKSAPRSVWFQYIWANPDPKALLGAGDYTPVTGSIGDRTVYTPWTYTIDFPSAGKHEYHGYRK